MPRIRSKWLENKKCREFDCRHDESNKLMMLKWHDNTCCTSGHRAEPISWCQKVVGGRIYREVVVKVPDAAYRHNRFFWIAWPRPDGQNYAQLPSHSHIEEVVTVTLFVPVVMIINPGACIIWPKSARWLFCLAIGRLEPVTCWATATEQAKRTEVGRLSTVPVHVVHHTMLQDTTQSAPNISDAVFDRRILETLANVNLQDSCFCIATATDNNCPGCNKHCGICPQMI